MNSIVRNNMPDQHISEQTQCGKVDTFFAREIEFSMLTYSAAKGQGVTVRLLNYDGNWKSKMYDKDETTEVRILVDHITWSKDDKSYMFEGNRVSGKRIGDTAIATESRPERYRITVTEISKPTSRFESLSADWSIIPPART